MLSPVVCAQELPGRYILSLACEKPSRNSTPGSIYDGDQDPMSTKTKLSLEIVQHMAQTLNLPLRGVVGVIDLLDDDGTVPFIARYRKEATGNLDEVQILAIEERLGHF